MFPLIEHVKALKMKRMTLFIVARFLALLHVYRKFMALKILIFSFFIKKRNVSPPICTPCLHVNLNLFKNITRKYIQQSNNMSDFCFYSANSSVIY